MIYFQNSFLEINPYLRKALFLIRGSLFLFLIIFSFILIISSLKTKYLGFLLLLVLIIKFLRKNDSKEDLRSAKERINLNEYLTENTKNFILETLTKSEILKIGQPDIFLLKELLKKREIQNVFWRLNIDPREIEKNLPKILNTISDIKKPNFYLESYLTILESAFFVARSLNSPNINLLFILYGLKKAGSLEVQEIFEKAGINNEMLLSAILMEIFSRKAKISRAYQPLALFQSRAKKRRILNKALTSKFTQILDLYGLDLTYLANLKEVGFLIGHQKESEKLESYLKDSENVLLIGEEGTGKETIIMNLAWKIQNEIAPKEILDYRLVKLDLSLIYSQNRLNFLEILTQIFNEVIDSGYIILYFPSIHQILLEEAADANQILIPVLKNRSIPIIATTTPEGYLRVKQVFDLDYYFKKIEVEPLNIEESIQLLTLKSLVWEKERKIIITPQSIQTAVNLAHEFIKNIPLPKSAEEILLEGIELAKKVKAKYLTKEAVQEIVFEKTKIPVKEITEIEKEKLLNLEELLHQRIVNQNYAVEEIARVLKIYRAGLDSKKGPIAVFLFVGPTGVGKTETAKALAKIYFGGSENMIRLDMVEFQNSEDLDKLIGSKDGKILGRLTETARQKPYSLILLDEFEKTHPTILKIFLPIFDEGKIKDALGREVDFTNTLIICTSNAYSEFIKESIEQGKNFEEIVPELKSKLSLIFSVELLNRFDNIIVYKPLGEKELIEIAKIIINDFRQDLILTHGIDLEVTEYALKEIVRLGTDPIYGARPLKRKIDEILKSEMANFLLEEKIKRGHKFFVDFQEGNFIFETK